MTLEPWYVGRYREQVRSWLRQTLKDGRPIRGIVREERPVMVTGPLKCEPDLRNSNKE